MSGAIRSGVQGGSNVSSTSTSSTSSIEMIETDDGFCAVEVGAETQPGNDMPDQSAPPANGDEIAWDLAATGVPDKPVGEQAVDITEYDVVLPESDAAPHADHHTPRPHVGLFSRLRRAASRSTETSDG